MLRLALPLLLAVQVGQGDRAAPDSATIESAYADSAVRAVVQRAREHRRLFDQSITRYRTLGVDRITVGISALRRERMLVRRETAMRIDWRRNEPTEVEVVGARLAVPMFIPGVQVPDDVDAQDLVFDPSGDRFFLGVMDSSFVFHPFGRNSETHYRYASGDPTSIRLQDGRTIRLLAVEVSPRIRDAHHFEGTVWVDADSHAMVRAVVRLAEPYDFSEEEDEDIPGFLEPIQGELRYLTIEYGLWDLRWWLPRIVALQGEASAGSFLRVPFEMERKYSEYIVEGDTAVAPIELTPLDSAARDSARDDCRALRDAANPERDAPDVEVRWTRQARCECDQFGCNIVYITYADSASLLTSEYLPESIYDDGSSLLTQTEIDELTSVLRREMPQQPVVLSRPRFAWGFGESGLLRYNRIEGLSIGARATMNMGWADAALTARLGVANLDPDVELGVTRSTPFNRYDVVAYRRLAAMNPETKPLGLGNSLSSLVLGYDDGEYFRATGAELRRQPATGFAWYSLRLYGETQRAVSAETDASLHHAVDGDYLFRPNRPAARADQLGADIAVRHARGLDPLGWRWGFEVRANGETGTYDFARASLTARLGMPLPGPFVGSLEAAGGTSVGELPIQSAWFLGGPATLRGYPGALLTGNAFWRGRAEIGTRFPAARVALFGDAGWAGDRTSRRLAPTAWSLGAGASFGDGLLRIDLARALEGEIGWKLHLYLDGIL
jgi:hypothetical protein